ncbi:cobalt-precorrin-6A reductase [Granulicella tundricola]|uniref:Precorrin-6x reductase n=1 Tax=Granulicella tundricola (strain ATCC BAA-1859 / DSM 23138 / MP5ACTX9) TaxID=1198114 RepID=E8X6S7_GRATM|nr:cobalt-precorrin-6A reductase [Granulicella tundricola]ADW71227.1 precorrin-6x reductase [Granulicella tundricola MP5ACTX9]
MNSVSNTRRPAVLLLGGTSEAGAIASHLATHPDLKLISSLAGRVAHPKLPTGQTRIGGFGGVEGLITYLQQEKIQIVIDATHPFAANISRNAAAACQRLGIPLISYVRPPWTPQQGDHWQDVPDLEAAAALTRSYHRIFLAIGRQELAPFATCIHPWFLIRTIDQPDVPLPPNAKLILARGPFHLADELRLLKAHAIDCIISKNSGGPATYDKLEAARILGLPVIMVDRPTPPTNNVHTIEAVLSQISTELGRLITKY